MIFNIENCDVTMENGYLRLIYHADKLPVPMVLAVTKSYHDLNERAMQLFDGDDWVESVVEWNLRKEDPIWHNLLADIYVSHNDIYKKVMSVNKEEATDYVALELTGEKDERGHRMGRFDIEDLKKMDYDCLKLLAKDLDVSEYDTLGPNDLAYSVSLVDIDVDDADCDYNCEDCDCAEMTDDGDYICHYDDDEDDCDEDCENCEYANLNDHDDENEPEDSADYEYVDGPAHYNGTECIENMRKLFGDEAVRWFCICNAYKYRFRDGSKPGVAAEQDEEKARWYEDYAVKMMGEQRYY
jgi:hypothetical protein|nr:MAG TPA: nucelotide kinase [Caudoviricetes sp.]